VLHKPTQGPKRSIPGRPTVRSDLGR